MTNESPSYHGYRFPAEIISHAVWLYHRFGLSFRDMEDLLTQRGVTVTHETIRRGVGAGLPGLGGMSLSLLISARADGSFGQSYQATCLPSFVSLVSMR